jgi:hypothetical protein
MRVADERFAELHTGRETTEAKLAAPDQARARDDDAALLDELPLLAGTVDLQPEHIQADPFSGMVSAAVMASRSIFVSALRGTAWTILMRSGTLWSASR